MTYTTAGTPPNRRYQKCFRKLEAPITMRVASGSSIFTSANMLWKTGMTKISRMTMAMAATDMMTAG